MSTSRKFQSNKDMQVDLQCQLFYDNQINDGFKPNSRLKMSKYIELLLKIDYEHWNKINPYFSEVALSASMKRGLKIIQNQGFLIDFQPSSAADYVIAIDSLTDCFDENNPDYEMLARVFDLIQAWGGQTGRFPYVVTKSRFKYDEWKTEYLNGVRQARLGNPVKALSLWLKISGLGASFAPKHLRFWTKTYPVLDTRISLLVSGGKKLLTKPEYYGDFLDLIKPLTTKFCANNLEVEKALFAFSQNFFINDRLEFKADNLHDEKDFHLAEQLTHLEL